METADSGVSRSRNNSTMIVTTVMVGAGAMGGLRLVVKWLEVVGSEMVEGGEWLGWREVALVEEKLASSTFLH